MLFFGEICKYREHKLHGRKNKKIVIISPLMTSLLSFFVVPFAFGLFGAENFIQLYGELYQILIICDLKEFCRKISYIKKIDELLLGMG